MSSADHRPQTPIHHATGLGGVTFRCGCCLAIRGTAGRKRLRFQGLPQWVCHVCVATRYEAAAGRR
jgi:hypothetical protein